MPSFGVPTATELAHDYLWRIHHELPERGRIGVFNRSHYEDVLVVRVKDLAPPARWRRRYGHIRDFERMLVDEDTAVVKLYLHISKEEQRARLQDRLDSPDERWKFRLGDLDDRARWDDYMAAYRTRCARRRCRTRRGTSCRAIASGCATSPWRRSCATPSSASIPATRSAEPGNDGLVVV